MLVYIWLHNKNHIYESGDFYYPPSPPQFWQLQTSKITSFLDFFNFLISHFGDISPVKKALGGGP
jgi:hypothetical protein